MCTEFVFVFIYFLAILIINYLLLKLLKNYLSKIIELKKWKKAFELFPEENFQFLSFFYFFQKNKNEKKLKFSLDFIKSEILDYLLLGNISRKITSQMKNEISYFKLIQLQFLNKK
jgi:hypothetical protein